MSTYFLVFVILLVFLHGVTSEDCSISDATYGSTEHIGRPPSSPAKIWALLVAGSNKYWNYRHQADVCHAYHLLSNHGVPKEQIIVMMYDDIAYNFFNPTFGVIINHLNGPNVYPGVPKDYTFDAVTPENFLDALQGKKTGGAKVIESGPDDRIFVFFSGPGSRKFLAFPKGWLFANDFINVIKDMKARRKFDKMLIYVEACHSGSMFEGLLPDNIGVYAITSANSNECSATCYYDNLRRTYLGNLFSVNWMEDSDRKNLRQETIVHQYKIVKTLTYSSHVQQFGDMSVANLTLSDFQGSEDVPPDTSEKTPLSVSGSVDANFVLSKKTKQSDLSPGTSPNVLVNEEQVGKKKGIWRS